MPDGSLVRIDQQIIADLVFKMGNGKEVLFQFPPKITGESNNSEWHVEDIWAIEPLKIHKGSGGRKVTMEWEYIATDSTFKPGLIGDQLRNLKSYFFEMERKIYPVVEIKYTQIIPILTQFRLMDVNITYGPELISNGGEIFPFYTKVVCNLELVTRINDPANREGIDKLEVQPLKFAVYEWY